MDKKLIFTIAVSAAISMNISKKSFKNGMFTCSNYVMNAYLYLLLSITLLATFVLLLENKNYKISYDTLLPAFFLGLGFLIAANTMKEDKMTIKHFAWFAFICCMAVTLYPAYKRMKDNKTVEQALLTTIIIVAIISIYVSKNPDKNVTKGWGPKLFIGLLSLLLFYVIALLTGNPRWTQGKLISMCIVAFFAMFLLYDTEKLYINAKKCGTQIKPDYINESLNLLLDMINIFVRSDRI